MNTKILKLAKLIIAFAEANSDKGKISWTGDLVEGAELFIEDSNGEFIPAPDGEYTVEEKIITVVDGKIESINIKEEKTEEQVDEVIDEALEEEQPTEDPTAELNAKIDELNKIIAEKDEYIGQLEAKIKELEAKLNESAGKKADEEFKAVKNSKNKALKYFNK